MPGPRLRPLLHVLPADSARGRRRPPTASSRDPLDARRDVEPEELVGEPHVLADVVEAEAAAVALRVLHLDLPDSSRGLHVDEHPLDLRLRPPGGEAQPQEALGRWGVELGRELAEDVALARKEERRDAALLVLL